jgi:hexosaminidase
MWRGVLLDVGRHFFTMTFILKLLDLMAMYKMNRLHWHLTEDQVGKQQQQQPSAAYSSGGNRKLSRGT